MGVKPHAVTLHIEELVLTGFPSGSRHAIADAVQAELARLMGDGGIGNALARGGNYDELRGDAFMLAPRFGPQASGRAIAERLYTTLSEARGKNGTR